MILKSLIKLSVFDLTSPLVRESSIRAFSALYSSPCGTSLTCIPYRVIQLQYVESVYGFRVWYKGTRMVLGGSGKLSFGRRIREDPYSG